MDLQKVISRTIRYILEPGKTQPNAHGWLGSKTADSNPDMLASIKGCCSSVFSSEDENAGCVLTVLHGLYDCEKAAKDLKFSLEQDGNDVCLYDCDNTDISEVFSETHLRKAGLKSGYIKKHSIDAVDFVKSFLLPLLLFLLPFTLTVLEKIADAKINTHLIYSIWVLAAIVALMIISVAWKTVQKRANTSLYFELIDKLNTLRDEKIQEFINSHCGIENVKFKKTSINIFLRFDKLQYMNRIAYLAVQNYLKNTCGHKQVNIIFVSQNQMRSYLEKQNQQYKYGLLYLNQLSFKEKDNLRKEVSSSLHISKLDYFGVDAILGYNERISDKYNQEDINKEIEKLRKYGEQNRCDPLVVLYLIAYFSCKYDIYMSISEMVTVFKSKESSRIVSTFINRGASKPSSFYNIIDFIVNSFDKYLILHNDGSIRRYKFPEELLSKFKDSCPEIPRVDISVWCIYIFLNSKLLVDKERLLLYCGETFNALTSDFDTFREYLPLFAELTISLLSKFERDAYYYYYEDIFAQLLYYANKYSKIRKRLIQSSIVETASMHNMIFSPGKMSWEQHRDFVKLQAEALGGAKLSISDVPIAFAFLGAPYEECKKYYSNLIKTNNERTIQFHEIIFNTYIKFNRLNLCDGSFNLFAIDKEPELRDIADFFPTDTNNEQINYIHETVDELHNMPQHLLLISEYIYYPITQLLACLALRYDKAVATDLDEEENNNLPEYNSNCVYDLIAKSCSIPVQKADYKRVIDIVLSNDFGREFKCRFFMTLSIMHNLYGNEISGFIKANIDDIIEIIKRTITDWDKSEAQLYHFFEALIILAKHIEQIDLVKSSIGVVSEKYPQIADDISKCLEYITENEKMRDSQGIVSIVERMEKFSENLAFLLINSYCEKEIDLETLKNKTMMRVIQNTTITSAFSLVLRYLIEEDNIGFETLSYLLMFLRHRNSCHSVHLCSESIEVVNKYSTLICKFSDPISLKNFFINREIYLHTEKLIRSLLLTDSYMLALSYNIYLISRFFPDKDYENKAEPSYVNVEENFLQISAIQNVQKLNPDYLFICVYVLNNNDVQKRLIMLHGRKAIVEHIRENAILLLNIIIKSVSESSLKDELQRALRMLNGLSE